ncbi:YkgJ family cysteine cluster protein [Lysobacter sp. A286]
MSFPLHTEGQPDAHDDDHVVDPTVSCDHCDAVCCRLTVVVMPEDNVPRHLVERTERGLEVMARDEDGWCVAVDQNRMCCSIYEQRPAICRKFTMGSGYCRSERKAYSRRYEREIPVTVI